MKHEQQTENMIKEEIKKIFLEQEEALPLNKEPPKTGTPLQPHFQDLYTLTSELIQCINKDNKNLSSWQECINKENIKPIAAQIKRELAKEKPDFKMINQLSITAVSPVATKCVPVSCAQIMDQINRASQALGASQQKI